MSPHTLHIRSESPDLLIEFDLLPGTYAKIGASPEAEITLPRLSGNDFNPGTQQEMTGQG